MSFDNKSTEKLICSCCGKRFEAKRRRGRPQIYCSQDCADFMKFKTAMEKMIGKIQFTPSASKQVRGDFFSFANRIFHDQTIYKKEVET